MKALTKITGLLMVLLAIAAFIMIGCGFYQFYKTELVQAPMIRALGDSTVTTTTVNDTIVGNPGKKHRSVATNTVVMRGNHKICERCKPFSDDLVKARYDNSYRLIYTGIFIILLLLLIPSLHDFSILGLFSGTFKDDIKDLKMLHNDAQTQVASSPQLSFISNNMLEQRAIRDKGSVKDKWGGSASNNSRNLSATIDNAAGTNEYLITLTVKTTNPANLLKGFVIFHLPDYFPNPNPKIFVIAGEASLKVRITTAFIVGAVADDGLTKLELDLATLSVFKKP